MFCEEGFNTKARTRFHTFYKNNSYMLAKFSSEGGLRIPI